MIPIIEEIYYYLYLYYIIGTGNIIWYTAKIFIFILYDAGNIISELQTSLKQPSNLVDFTK